MLFLQPREFEYLKSWMSMSILTGSQGMLLILSESKGSLLRFGKEYTAKTRDEGKSESR